MHAVLAAASLWCAANVWSLSRDGRGEFCELKVCKLKGRSILQRCERDLNVSSLNSPLAGIQFGLIRHLTHCVR